MQHPREGRQHLHSENETSKECNVWKAKRIEGGNVKKWSYRDVHKFVQETSS